jgi:uncharacterized protein
MIRNALRLTSLVALLMTAGWQPAAAASFDCSEAETADEKAVCVDRKLNDEDVEMASVPPILNSEVRECLVHALDECGDAGFRSKYN